MKAADVDWLNMFLRLLTIDFRLIPHSLFSRFRRCMVDPEPRDPE
jgi:hypothetical protein